MSLEVVKAHLGDRQFSAALAVALDDWRTSRHPTIAEVIDHLWAQCERPALTSVGAEETQREWLAAAVDADAATRGVLAELLTARLPIDAEYFGILRDDYTDTKYAHWFQRIRAMQEWPADPRVATALMQVLLTPKFAVYDVGRTMPVYRPVAALLVQTGDVRVLPALRQVAAQPSAKLSLLREIQRTLALEIIAALESLSVPLLVDEEAWRALLPKKLTSRPSADPAQLLAQIAAAHDDDTPRLVYADLLTEAGDPRGEFISLQIAEAHGRATPKDVKRAASLLKKHRDAWLGPLALTLKVKFARGFAHEATLNTNSSADPDTWARAYADPRLNTVELLSQGRGSDRHLMGFYDGGALVNLKSVELPRWQALRVLQGTPLAARVERLTVPARGLSTHHKAFVALQLPRLKELNVVLANPSEAVALELLERAPWAQQLTRLTLSAVWPPIDLTTLWHRVSRWAALRELVIHDSMTVERVEGRVKITFKPWWEEAVLAWLKQSDLALGEVYCRVDRPLVQREALEARIEALGGRLVEEANAV